MVVQTSLWEGSSNILIEALACKKKIVCYDIQGGTKEILDNGKNGLLAKYNDYKDLSKKILLSLNQRRNIDQRKLSLFSVENNLKKYKKLFDSK